MSNKYELFIYVEFVYGYNEIAKKHNDLKYNFHMKTKKIIETEELSIEYIEKVIKEILTKREVNQLSFSHGTKGCFKVFDNNKDEMSEYYFTITPYYEALNLEELFGI